MRLITVRKAVASAMVLLPCLAATAAAQVIVDKDRTPATVVVLPSLRQGQSDALVIRRKDQKPHDVIVIKKSMITDALLAEAVHQLQVARQLGGLVPQQDAMFRVRLTNDQRKRAHTKEAARWISVLMDAADETVPGVGSGPVIVLYLSNTELTATKKQ